MPTPLEPGVRLSRVQSRSVRFGENVARGIALNYASCSSALRYINYAIRKENSPMRTNVLGLALCKELSRMTPTTATNASL